MSDKRERLDRTPPWGRYSLIALALLVLAGVGAYFVWSAGSSGRLERLVAQYKAAGEPIDPSDFRDAPIANDDDNAAVALRDAARIDTKTKAWDAHDKLSYEALPLTDKEVAALKAVLAPNQASFDAIDLAMRRKGVDWGIAIKSPALSTLLPDLSDQRHLAVLVSHRALLNYQEGHHDAALRDLDRLLFIARTVDRQPFLVSHLVADGIESMTADDVQQMAGGLKIGSAAGDASPQQVAELMKKLLDDRAQHEAQVRAILGERMLELDTTRCVADGRLNLAQIGSVASGKSGGANAAAAAAGLALRPMVLGDGAIMLRHTTAIAAALKTSPDWPTYQSNAPPIPPEVTDGGVIHLLARMLLPSFDRAVRTDYRLSGDRRMAAIGLAIRQYALDHGGHAPTKLDELVPKYLPSVPLDTFARNQPIHYLPRHGDPILYSVGENGVDDAGSEASKQKNKNIGKWERDDAVVHLTPQPRPVPAEDTDSGVEPPPASTQPATAPTSESAPR